MRSLWTIVSVMAVANMLALLAFAAWLRATDRLDADRLAQVREMLSETITQEKARTEREQAAAEAAEAAAVEEAALREPPLASSDVLGLKIEESEADRLRAERLRREAQDIRAALRRERELLDEQRAEFETERSAFERMRKELAELEGSKQFKRTLATYEGLKPPAVRTVFLELLKPQADGAVDEAGAKQVVAYLNAMQDRARSKIIDEFVQNEPKVAAVLLERLRTHGLAPDGPEAPADAGTLSAADRE